MHRLYMSIFLLALYVCGSYASGRASNSKCPRCKKLVEGFRKGEEKTARQNFGGGDVHWEERKKISYHKSETRLVEIIESACESKNHQCTSFLEDHEELLEKWWFKKQNKFPDLEDWLCRIRTKVCCRDNEYGKNCTKCPGPADKPCNGHGECDGAGQRIGSGMCMCNYGYTGDTCESCEKLFFNETKLNECLNCHRGCKDGCTGAYLEHCSACNDGFRERTAGGCVDVDECTETQVNGDGSTSPMYDCPTDQYCSNTEGKYDCESCHRDCATCRGPERTHCTSCTSGYHFIEKSSSCDDIDECVEGAAVNISQDTSTDIDAEVTVEDDTAPKTTIAYVAVCTDEKEYCFNKVGSYVCLCVSGFTRKDGVCVPKPDPATPSEPASDAAKDTTGVPDTEQPSAPVPESGDVTHTGDDVIHSNGGVSSEKNKEEL